MSLACLAAGILLGQQAPLREISFHGDVFTLKGPEGPARVSIKPGFEPMNTASGQLWLPVDKFVLTFDENGVGFRKDNRVSYATYASVATSPKLFSHNEIDFINREVAAGRRSLDVSAVSGWEKIGNTAYLLLRWDDRTGQPWLEALMKFEFAGGKPSASFLGRFDSYTRSAGRVNDKLIAENGQLHVVTHGAKDSLLESMSLESGDFSKYALQGSLTDAKLIAGSLYGMGLRRTPAKTWLVSLIDREANSCRPVAEVRGAIQGLFAPAIVQYAAGGRSMLLSLTTGAEIVIPPDCGVESVPAGMLLWTPAVNPKVAALYSAGSFRTLARWSRP